MVDGWEKKKKKKAFWFKKKPLSAMYACFLLHADFPSPVLPFW